MEKKRFMMKKKRAIFDKIEFVHGGQGYDDKYPEGIPTTVELEWANGNQASSGLVMFPGGHARNTRHNLKSILEHKNKCLGALAVEDVDGLLTQLSDLESKTAAEMLTIYNCDIIDGPCID